MSDELKPCPFCGGRAVYYIDHTTEQQNSVYCESCDVTVSDFGFDMPTGYCREFWNTRTASLTPQMHAKVLDRAREFLNNLQGESGLTGRDVDRLCGILHGRDDIYPRPLDNFEAIAQHPKEEE